MMLRKPDDRGQRAHVAGAGVVSGAGAGSGTGKPGKLFTFFSFIYFDWSRKDVEIFEMNLHVCFTRFARTQVSSCFALAKLTIAQVANNNNNHYNNNNKSSDQYEFRALSPNGACAF